MYVCACLRECVRACVGVFLLIVYIYTKHIDIRMHVCTCTKTNTHARACVSACMHALTHARMCFPHTHKNDRPTSKCKENLLNNLQRHLSAEAET